LEDGPVVSIDVLVSGFGDCFVHLVI